MIRSSTLLPSAHKASSLVGHRLRRDGVADRKRPAGSRTYCAFSGFPLRFSASPRQISDFSSGRIEIDAGHAAPAARYIVVH